MIDAVQNQYLSKKLQQQQQQQNFQGWFTEIHWKIEFGCWKIPAIQIKLIN